VWVRDYCRVFYDDAGQPARMIGCTINIDARKRAEDALVQSQQIVQAQLAELEGIYQNAAIGLCILDRDLRYIRINERLAEMNGLPASAHIGRTIHEIVPDLAPVAEPILREILATGKSILNYELHGETAAQPGRQRIWLESWLPIHTLQGEVIGVNVVTEEITDRKQIERRTTSLLELAAALSVALTPVEAAQAILQEGGQGLGATGGSVVILLEDGKTLELLGSFGYPIPTQQHWRQFPLDLPTAPLAVAVKTRKPLWFGSLEERLAQIPFTPNAPIDSAHQAWASLPLLVNDQVVGGLGLSFPTPQGFEQAERDFMMTLAHLCAQALERARLHQQAKQLAAYEERQRLARELHDSVSQVLFSSSIMAETLPQVWARDPQRAMERLTEIVTYNRAAMAEMRTLLLELRPESIVRTPLRELLEQQVRVVQGRKTLDIQLHIDGAESPAVPEVHVALYRITQESLNNVVKHSHASRVRVELQTSPSRVRLHISDDGRGFDLKRTTAGIGLNSIRERAQMIGAVLRLHSAVGQGTQLTLEWSASNN
jgi:PAS domain S-box-containing protein